MYELMLINIVRVGLIVLAFLPFALHPSAERDPVEVNKKVDFHDQHRRHSRSLNLTGPPHATMT